MFVNKKMFNEILQLECPELKPPFNFNWHSEPYGMEIRVMPRIRKPRILSLPPYDFRPRIDPFEVENK